MSTWKDEDLATPDLVNKYLQEFAEGINNNPACQLTEEEKPQVHKALDATRKFSLELVSGHKKLYMHDLILMAIGFYGGYLTASDTHASRLPLSAQEST